jgi:hypothetical protein
LLLGLIFSGRGSAGPVPDFNILAQVALTTTVASHGGGGVFMPMNPLPCVREGTCIANGTYTLNSGYVCLEGIDCSGQSGSSPTTPVTMQAALSVSCSATGDDYCGVQAYYGVFDISSLDFGPGTYDFALSIGGTANDGLTGSLYGCVYLTGDNESNDCLSQPFSQLLDTGLPFLTNDSGNVTFSDGDTSEGLSAYLANSSVTALGIEFYVSGYLPGAPFAGTADLAITGFTPEQTAPPSEPAAPTPEPSSPGLVCAALLGAGLWWLKRQAVERCR